MNRIGIAVKPNHPRAKAVVLELRKWLSDRGVEVGLDDHAAQTIGESCGMDRSELLARSDMVIVLGGDGTLLSFARLNRLLHTPLLPVNLGSLGFLTVITLDELFDALALILEGQYDIDHRMMLDVAILRQGKPLFEASVFNDAVINKAAIARIIDLETCVDHAYVTTYKADGLIISSPSGSTAYSLSAGGPIVHPALSAFILTPICPHTLTNRPVVISSASIVEVTLKSREAEVVLTLDGQLDHPLLHNDVVMVKRSADHVPLIKFSSYDYFAVLRTKLHWGER